MQLSLDSALIGSFKFFTSFGRTALYAALCAIDVKGKEVLLPAFTCNTTVVPAVIMAGAVPVFVDVAPGTLNMDLIDLKNKITSRTVAVISHHYYGFVTSNLDDLNSICEQTGLIHIEDCAHSIGSSLAGKPVGSWGKISVYSFSKSMITPGGGCMCTYDPDIYAHVNNDFSHARLLDRLFVNYYAFDHLCQLFSDIRGGTHPLSFMMALSHYPIGIIRKLARYDAKRINGFFYRLEDLVNNHIKFNQEMSIAMTQLQRTYIERSMQMAHKIIEKRKELFFKLLNTIEPAITIDRIVPSYSYYIIKIMDKRHVITKAKAQGIRLRETWPAFQNYLEEQMTPSIRLIADNYLIVNLEQYSHDSGQNNLVGFFECL